MGREHVTSHVYGIDSEIQTWWMCCKSSMTKQETVSKLNHVNGHRASLS